MGVCRDEFGCKEISVRSTVKSKYTKISNQIYFEKTSTYKARTDLFRKPQEVSSILECVCLKPE